MLTRRASILCLGLTLLGCQESFHGNNGSTEASGESNAEGDGDGDASADGMSNSAGDGDAGDGDTGDGDGSTGDGDGSTGDGDGSTGDGDGSTGDGDGSTGDGDGSTGDGDGSTGDGDGDGDGEYCNGATAITFNDPFERSVGASITQMFAGDYVGDQTIDVIAMAGNATEFIVLRNNGGGGNFPDSQITTVSTGSVPVESVALGALDAGSKLDVLAVTEEGFNVYFGTDQNTLPTAITVLPPANQTPNYGSGTIVDLGGLSSRGDIVVGRQVGGNEEIIIYDGMTFETAPAPDFTGVSLSDGVQQFVYGQFDTDNEVDVIGLLQNDPGMDGTLATMHNSAGNDLSLDDAVVTATLGGSDFAWVSDLDLDGRDDVVTSNTGVFGGDPEEVTIYWGTDSGISNADKTSIVVGDLLGFLSVRDFNCDGHRDIAVAVAGEARVLFLAGDSARNFVEDGEIDLGDDGPYTLVSEDFDGDGAPDIMVSMPMVEKIRVYTHI